jgi:hypothetical protein
MNGEDEVGPGALLVRGGHPHSPVHASFLEVEQGLLLALHCLHALVAHCLSLGVVPQLYYDRHWLAFLRQQVSYLLVVYLDNADLDPLIGHDSRALL